MGFTYCTIGGLNSLYESVYNDNIFEDIELPEGIDKDVLIQRIMFRCMEFPLMHTDKDFIHYEILNFFKVHYNTFLKWITALDIEYNPLENYDRYEQYGGSGSNSGSSTSSGSDNSTDTTKKAAYNSSTFENYEQSQVTGTSSMTGSNSGQYQDAHTIHTHGNIGVTTSQQMLESEWEVSKLNIYTAIADLFADEFCIMVY